MDYNFIKLSVENTPLFSENIKECVLYAVELLKKRKINIREITYRYESKKYHYLTLYINTTTPLPEGPPTLKWIFKPDIMNFNNFEKDLNKTNVELFVNLLSPVKEDLNII